MSALMQEYLLLLASKKSMILKNKEQVTTLALGSSHGDYGFDPAFFPGSFNLCCRSQDLKNSYYLYRYAEQICKNLQNVILFFGLFMPGWVLEKNKGEQGIAAAINKVFDLGVCHSDEALNNLVSGASVDFSDSQLHQQGAMGFLTGVRKPFISMREGAEKRVEVHTRNFEAQDSESMGFFSEMLKLAKANGQKVFIVIPPAHSEYRRFVGNNKTVMRQQLQNIADSFGGKDFVVVEDCLSDLHLDDDLFGDFDHINPIGAGAEIFTRHVQKLVESKA